MYLDRILEGGQLVQGTGESIQNSREQSVGLSKSIQDSGPRSVGPTDQP